LAAGESASKSFCAAAARDGAAQLNPASTA